LLDSLLQETTNNSWIERAKPRRRGEFQHIKQQQLQ